MAILSRHFHKRFHIFANRSPSASLFLLAALLVGCGSTPQQTVQPASGTHASPTDVKSGAPKPASNTAASPKSGAAEQHPIENTSPKGAQRFSELHAQMAHSCADLICYSFDTPRLALDAVLFDYDPQIIAFGEAHTPQGFDGPSTVARFNAQLLSAVAMSSHALTVELLAPPNQGCHKEVTDAEAESKEITQGQSANNQNEYVALGFAARRLAMIPDILRPTCEDMSKIAAPDGGVLVYMETIARLVTGELTRLYGSRSVERPRIVSYGGALHNDAQPRPQRESWSFGPAMVALSDGRYLEVDLVIPELIQANETWQSFPWYRAYDACQDKNRTQIIPWGQHSVALIFPSRATSSPQ